MSNSTKRASSSDTVDASELVRRLSRAAENHRQVSEDLEILLAESRRLRRAMRERREAEKAARQDSGLS